MASRHRFVVEGRERTVVLDQRDGRTVASIDGGEAVEIDVATPGAPGLFSLVIGGKPARAHVSRRGQLYDVTVEGRRFALTPSTGGGRARGVVGGLDDAPGKVTAPLAGVVVALHVSVGDTIERGQLLVVVEAMKMQNEVSAQRDGTITAIHCEVGGRAERGDILIEYDSAE